MIEDTAEKIRQPSLRINTSQLRGLDQRISNGSSLSAPIRAHEEIILASENYPAHATPSSIIVDAETAIVEKGAQPLETDQIIADCAAKR